MTSLCAIEACSVKVVCRGWCNAHYLRWRNHGDPLGGKKSPATLRAIDHEDGTRTCSKCGTRQPLAEYDKDSNGSLGRRAKCKKCRSEQMKDWYSANRDRQMQRARDRFVRDVDKIRENDKARYERDREKRIDLATEAVHRRRAVLTGARRDRGITVTALRKRDGDDCCYCNVTMSFVPVRHGEYEPTRATIEHVLPLSVGGLHVWENVALACWQCNVRKNKRTREEWERIRG